MEIFVTIITLLGRNSSKYDNSTKTSYDFTSKLFHGSFYVFQTLATLIDTCTRHTGTLNILWSIYDQSGVMLCTVFSNKAFDILFHLSLMQIITGTYHIVGTIPTILFSFKILFFKAMLTYGLSIFDLFCQHDCDYFYFQIFFSM